MLRSPSTCNLIRSRLRMGTPLLPTRPVWSGGQPFPNGVADHRDNSANNMIYPKSYRCFVLANSARANSSPLPPSLTFQQTPWLSHTCHDSCQSRHPRNRINEVCQHHGTTQIRCTALSGERSSRGNGCSSPTNLALRSPATS